MNIKLVACADPAAAKKRTAITSSFLDSVKKSEWLERSIHRLLDQNPEHILLPCLRTGSAQLATIISTLERLDGTDNKTCR